MNDTQSDTASQNDDATPETDQSTFSAEDHRGEIFDYIEPDFARRLERERNFAKGQAIYWQDKATQFAKERDEAREQRDSLRDKYINRCKDMDEYRQQRDESIKLAGELIHIIRINALRGAMGPEITKKKVDDFLCPYGTRLLNIKGGADAI